jgi:ferredoxin
MQDQSPSIIAQDGLAALIAALQKQGYRVMAPTRHDAAIVYDEIAGINDLPAGWTDQQDGGTYRLLRRDDAALFGYVAAPQSWKRFLHAPLAQLWQLENSGEGTRISDASAPQDRLALLGVRACELQAIAVQDRVLLQGPYTDRQYQARRQGAFIVAVNCGQAGGTCFCVSMHGGPKAKAGYDLALTELLGEEHAFLVEVGSERGADLLAGLPHRPATAVETARAEAIIAHTAASMGRTMPSDDVRELLLGNLEHKQWDDVAERCLTCGNCTLVCPTCFCTTVWDETSLSGEHTERWRRWDSCFTVDFSYLHGGSVRTSAQSRYRQWITHKLANWVDQFGTSGCVGCGRCITWCPVGIDITAEVRAIRESPAAPGVKET